MKIYSVDDVACRINSIWSKTLWSLVFIKHSASLLNKSYVLALHGAILLGSVWSRELMSDIHGIQVEIETSVLELSAVITSDVLDLDAIVRHGTIGEASEDILHFILVEDYVHPSIS